MKNLFLILLFVVSSTITAQENLSVTVCDHKTKQKVTNKTSYNSITLSQENLMECLKLKANNKKWKVSSFQLGFKAGNDYIEIKTKGHIINSKMVTLIKKHNPKNIYIENIILINNDDETTKVPNLVLETK